MADRESEVIAKIVSGVSGLNGRAWDRLAGDDPFLSHAFLSALEASGSVGPDTGWTPAPILVEDEAGHLVAAAPAYLKTHSQGEYVFDHGWADGWERAGGAYWMVNRRWKLEMWRILRTSSLGLAMRTTASSPPA